MATYEFRCKKCGEDFEEKRPMSQSSDPAQCPKCGGEGEKMISGFASTFGYGIKGPSKEPFRSQKDKK